MPQGRSHTGSFMPLINKLKEQGHEVSLYMEAYPDEKNFGLKDQMLKITNRTNPFASDEFESFQWKNDFVVTSQMFPFFYGADSCDIVLREHRDFFNKMVKEHFDLIFTDTLFAACAYGFTSLNKANHVLMSSTHVDSAVGSMRAHGINFVMTPRSFMPSLDVNFKPELFYYRITGTLEWIVNFFVIGLLVNERMKTSLIPVAPSFSFIEYQRTASMTFTDMPNDLIGPFPRTNDLFDYGAYCPTPKPLSGELLNFVSAPHSKGTILVAFGTVINWGRVPREKFKALLETFNSLTDYRIVWAYNGRPLDTKPHVYKSKWIPQIDVLYDNRTVLFFNHGGLKSLKEATCSSTPAVFMPMFAEQVRNGWMAKNNGYAEVFSKHELTAENLLRTLKRVLENRSRNVLVVLVLSSLGNTVIMRTRKRKVLLNLFSDVWIGAKKIANPQSIGLTRSTENLNASRREMEKIIYDFYSDLLDSHVHLPPHHLREDGHVIPEVLPSKIRHVVSCMLCRIEKILDEGQPCEQAGYRKGFSTIDHIHTISKLNDVSREYKMPLCLTFIDLKKAFDSVETEAVVEALDNQGVPTQYIKVLRELYSNFTSGISPFHKNIITDVKRGVGQGDTISPKIFTATVENAMRKFEWDDMGVKIDGRQLHHLRFADDIVLVTPSISQAERMLTEFDETCGCIGLQLNLQKTMFMCNGWVSDAPLMLNGTNISDFTSYVYVGRELNMMNDLIPELGRRKRAAWGAYKSIEGVVKGARNTRLRAHLFNTTVLPALTYVSETWAFRKQEENASMNAQLRE
ncbi:hypothetical protein RB195_014658 [Necator americanus]|uniref:glucuronosyltransferase n=2 Tax=Necator americanus TaxID=51031 RepID=A0ABR1E128_NECAM